MYKGSVTSYLSFKNNETWEINSSRLCVFISSKVGHACSFAQNRVHRTDKKKAISFWSQCNMEGFVCNLAR